MTAEVVSPPAEKFGQDILPGLPPPLPIDTSAPAEAIRRGAWRSYDEPQGLMSDE